MVVLVRLTEADVDMQSDGKVEGTALDIMIASWDDVQLYSGLATTRIGPANLNLETAYMKIDKMN